MPDLGPVPPALLADTNCEDLEKAFATNVLGPLRLTKALLGALSASAREESAWDEIKKSRATVLFRGDVPADGKGFFFPVTILANPPEDASFVTQEIFGPIRSVFKYKTVDEAIRRANDTSYGLGASVWGNNSDALKRVARQLEAGTAWINQHAIRNAFVPATAYKSSGIGVEFGQEGLLEYCHLQVIAAKQ
jgi:acyl-CoA reductase-like NAD-dependent aldehyde dehydrogenase